MISLIWLALRVVRFQLKLNLSMFVKQLIMRMHNIDNPTMDQQIRDFLIPNVRVRARSSMGGGGMYGMQPNYGMAGGYPMMSAFAPQINNQPAGGVMTPAQAFGSPSLQNPPQFGAPSAPVANNGQQNPPNPVDLQIQKSEPATLIKWTPPKMVNERPNIVTLFGVAPLLPPILVGTVAQQVPGKLNWCAKSQSFDNAAANALVKPFVRKGWEI